MCPSHSVQRSLRKHQEKRSNPKKCRANEIQILTDSLNCDSSPPTEGLLVCTPHPSRNSNSALYPKKKRFAFAIPPPWNFYWPTVAGGGGWIFFGGAPHIINSLKFQIFIFHLKETKKPKTLVNINYVKIYENNVLTKNISSLRALCYWGCK